MKIQTVDNYLPNEIFLNMKEIFLNTSKGFPWYLSNIVGGPDDKSDFYFFHILYANQKQESRFFESLVHPLIGRQHFTYLYRARCNLYTKKSKKIYTKYHTDDTNDHKVLLYNITTNNGFTMFENGQKILSVENQAILFDGKIKHRSVAQTDKDLRINININYI